MTGPYETVLEVTRGKIVESVHNGAAAVVDSGGRLLAWLGDPQTVTFLRSSAKPIQALPFIEHGGDQTFHLTSKEVAIICASHDGTDEQVDVIKGIQAKVGIQESDLLCGAHLPYHTATAEAMLKKDEQPTANRHNCSGKHTGMLAFARMRGLPISDYVNPEHPIQKSINTTIAELCSFPEEKIEIGIDGCSAPVHAIPLYNAALGFARLADPRGLSVDRATACRRITASMMANPVMIGGPGRFDTCLMEVCSGRLIAKVGAEGYMAIGVMAGALGPESPGIGLVVKIADGDISLRKPNGETYNRARTAVTLEILRQMGYISDKELEALSTDFGPVRPVTNWRKFVVGESRPAFKIKKPEPA